jgi:hypothetical protein
MLIEVVYPRGERVTATGYVGGVLWVSIVPEGPEAAYLDELEVDYAGEREPYPVVRVVGGPRNPTLRVRLALDEAALDRWMTARDDEGWSTRVSDTDPRVVLVVACRAGLDARSLEAHGAVLEG